ncbi:PcfB family protein [Arcanobacterium bovis]|uniref:PcfB family protein n=1 Tax=Arcanobacterium bovis TaxID=2529275 RepID=A0A4Q9V014_9ACTO|nr:PcfB family protein [Arcanobacterium bovis]TBW20711.1 PcfB family protein [Arcanobacterium bovis]
MIIADDIINQAVMTYGRGAIQFTSHISGKVTKKILLQSITLALLTIKHTPGLPGSPDRGQMTLRRLQKNAGGDIHPVEISQELKDDVAQYLRRKGVDFAIEKAPDGSHYIHFKGSDVSIVEHALKQVKIKLKLTDNIELDPQDKQEEPAQDIQEKNLGDAETNPDMPVIDGDQLEITGVEEVTPQPQMQNINDWIPQSMADQLNGKHYERAVELVNDAHSQGWKASFVKNELSAQPWNPEQTNSGGLVIYRLNSVLSKPRPLSREEQLSAKQQMLADAEKDLQAIIDGTSELTPREQWIRVNSLADKPDIAAAHNELLYKAIWKVEHPDELPSIPEETLDEDTWEELWKPENVQHMVDTPRPQTRKELAQAIETTAQTKLDMSEPIHEHVAHKGLSR